MTFSKGSKHGLVLQGFFRTDQFRVQAGEPARAAVQGKAGNFWVGKAPRPDWMPTGTRKAVVQLKGALAGHRAAKAPRLLPGMGRPKLGMPGGVAQRRSVGVSMSSLPEGQPRLIEPGKPLERPLRAKLEGFFGANFSGVRVHEGPAAQVIGALAFTLGETLCFAPGRYDPTTRAGIELLGHELVHVVQQRDGRVLNPYGRGVAIVQDPELEVEAEVMGRKVADEIWARAGARGGVRGNAARFPIPGMQQSRRATALQALFDDDFSFGNMEDSSDEEVVTYDEAFWNIIDTLASDNVPNVIRDISLNVSLITGQPQGFSDVIAKIGSPGTPPSFRVEKIASATTGLKEIYWLPWKPGLCTSAQRADYESSCNYFFTTELDGCTFVITDEEVMHVAHDYRGEKGRAGNVIARFAPATYQGEDTKRRGFVFGVRRDTTWRYYLCMGPSLNNCQSVTEVVVKIKEYPYGSPGHFSLM